MKKNNLNIRFFVLFFIITFGKTQIRRRTINSSFLPSLFEYGTQNDIDM